jgi:nucleotide-binding universal stress UspA family protein
MMSQEEISIKKILVPIDGSDASLKAAKYAIKAAKCEKARIICMYVVAMPENTSEFVGKPQSYYDELKKSTRPWFEEIKEAGKKMGVDDDDITTDIVTDFSSIPQAIVRYASNKNADLIVIGTTGKTGLKRFLIGSVAESVVRHAHSPVLVVR